MNLQEIIEALNLKILSKEKDFSSILIESGYISDLLSCVMAGAKSKSVWVTLMAHGNIIAVASLLEISAIIITENAQPEAATIAKANDEDIVILSTAYPSFDIVGQLWDLGLKG